MNKLIKVINNVGLKPTTLQLCGHYRGDNSLLRQVSKYNQCYNTYNATIPRYGYSYSTTSPTTTKIVNSNNNGSTTLGGGGLKSNNNELTKDNLDTLSSSSTTTTTTTTTLQNNNIIPLNIQIQHQQYIKRVKSLSDETNFNKSMGNLSILYEWNEEDYPYEEHEVRSETYRYLNLLKNNLCSIDRDTVDNHVTKMFELVRMEGLDGDASILADAYSIAGICYGKFDLDLSLKYLDESHRLVMEQVSQMPKHQDKYNEILSVLYELYGKVYAIHDDYQMAVEYYLKSVEQSPYFYQTLEKIMHIGAEHDPVFAPEIKEYIELVKQTHHLSSETADKYISLIRRVLEKEKKHNRRMDLWGSLKDEQIPLYNMAFYVGESKSTREDIDGAIAFYKLASMSCENTTILLAIADAYFKQQEFDQALLYANKSIEKDPKSLRSIQAKMNCLHAFGYEDNLVFREFLENTLCDPNLANSKYPEGELADAIALKYNATSHMINFITTDLFKYRIKISPSQTLATLQLQNVTDYTELPPILTKWIKELEKHIEEDPTVQTLIYGLMYLHSASYHLQDLIGLDRSLKSPESIETEETRKKNLLLHYQQLTNNLNYHID